MSNRNVFIAFAAAFVVAIGGATYGQVSNPGVQQSGAVTANHFAKWGPGVGQIQDGGAIPGSFVTSWNARTGAVVPVINDYDFNLIGPSALGCTQLPTFTGDVTNSNCAMTLASIISAGGPTGSATVAPIITYDAKGRLTAVSSATITPAASSITGAAALTKVDDTNVTMTLGGTPATSLLRATSMTLGWTGTLSIARGGTGAGTQQAAFDALAPTATVAGSIIHWNGTHWVKLDGNGSGTKVLQEDSSGVPSWVTGGTGTVTSAVIAAGAGMGTFTGTCTITTTGTCNIVGSGAQLPGTTTNDNASAGNVGEYVSSTVAAGSAVSLSTGTAKTITSISLTAGDWDVSGIAKYTLAGSTVLTVALQSVSLVDNTRGSNANESNLAYGAGITGGSDPSQLTPPVRLSLASTTTVYLVGFASFSVSTVSAYGAISARRVR